MAVLSVKRALEETLKVTEINLDKLNEEVALFSRLAQRALFCPDKKTRKEAQARIHNRYFGSIKQLDIEDERIVFTFRSVKQVLGEKPDVEEYSCTLCNLPNYLMDQPYYPILFFE